MSDNTTTHSIKFFPVHKTILAATVVIGLAALLFYLFRCVNIYRDAANCYAYAVREAATGDFSYVLDPGLPVMSMLAAVPFALTGLDAYKSLMLAGGLFWILTIIPLYYLLRRFTENRILAATGCLFYILTPKLIRFSCGGLPESPRNFFLLLSLLMLFLLQDRKTAGRAILFAFSLAGLTLSRAESMVVAGVIFLLLLVNGFPRKSAETVNFRSRAIRHILFCIGTGLLTVAFLSPRLAYQIEKTGYPTPDTRYNPYINAVFHLDRIIKTPEDFPPTPEIRNSAAAYAETGRFEWGSNLKSVFNGFLRGSYELYLALGVIGFVLCIFRFTYPWQRLALEGPEIVRRGWRLEYTEILLVTLVHSILYFIDCSAYRYYTFFVPFAILWGLIPLDFLLRAADRIPCRSVVVILAAGFLLLAFFQIRNGLSFAWDGDLEYHLGNVLREHAGEFRSSGRPRIYTGYPEVAYYSGFEYSNSSLNCKSIALTAREGDFDLAVFPPDDARCKMISDKFGLEEWKNNPCAENMTVLVPSRNSIRR